MMLFLPKLSLENWLNLDKRWSRDVNLTYKFIFLKKQNMVLLGVLLWLPKGSYATDFLSWKVARLQLIRVNLSLIRVGHLFFLSGLNYHLFDVSLPWLSIIFRFLSIWKKFCSKMRLNISSHNSYQLPDLFQAYPSNKPLGNWTRDLVLRVEQFGKWATTAHQPVIFWMSGFTFPTGFLTAVLQTCARQNNVSVDSLSWEFVVSTVDDSNITQQPKVREED